MQNRFSSYNIYKPELKEGLDAKSVFLFTNASITTSILFRVTNFIGPGSGELICVIEQTGSKKLSNA